MGDQDSTAGKDETDALTGTDRTVFVTCHAALLQPLPFCVSVCVCVHLTWVRRCRTPLHGCQKRAWCIHSTVQLGKPAAP